MQGTDGAVHVRHLHCYCSCTELFRCQKKSRMPRVMSHGLWCLALSNGILAFAMLLPILFCGGDIATEATESATQYPFISIFTHAVGSNAGGTIMTAIILILQFCSAVGGLAAASRMTWSFARDQGLPGSKFLRRVRPRQTLHKHY